MLNCGHFIFGESKMEGSVFDKNLSLVGHKIGRGVVGAAFIPSGTRRNFCQPQL